MMRRISELGGVTCRPHRLLAVAVLAIVAAAASAGGIEASEPARADREPVKTKEGAASKNASPTDRQPKSPAALSVAPLDHVEYPGDRPEWLDHDPDSPGRLPETWSVVSGPSETPEESADRLRVLTRAAVASYVKQVTGADSADFFPIRRDWVDSVLVEDRYAGTLTRGGMRMHESAVALRFTPDVQQEILAAWQETQLRGRLMLLAAAAGAVVVVLMVLSAALGMIGRYSRRRAAVGGAA